MNAPTKYRYLDPRIRNICRLEILFEKLTNSSRATILKLISMDKKT